MALALTSLRECTAKERKMQVLSSTQHFTLQNWTY